MIILLLGLIGVLAGLGLDALVARLAVAPDDWDEPGEAEDGDPTSDRDDEAEEIPPPLALAESASLHAEAGSLVVHPARSEWVRRVAVVGATAGLFALAAYRYDDPLYLGLVTAYICVLIVCASTDIISFRVPNVVTYPAILAAIVVAAVLPEADLMEALAGGALAGGILFLPAIFTGGVGMGMGDVKLAAFIGLALGFTNVVPALIFMALAGGLVAAIFLLTGARKRGEPIPYAPFIAGGAVAAMMLTGTAFVHLM